MSGFLKNDQGATLAELAVTTAIVGIATLLAATILTNSSTQAHRLDKSSQALSDQTLFRLQIQKAVASCVTGKLWINQQVANNIHVPWPMGSSLVTDPVGAIAVFPSTFVDANGTSTTDASNNFDAFYFIEKSSLQPAITLDVADASNGGYPGYLIDTSQTSQTFNTTATNPAVIYPANTIVALESLAGTQFAKVTTQDASTITLDWSAFGQFQIGDSSQKWPNLYLTSGMSVFPVEIKILAVNSAANTLTLWQFDFNSLALKSINAMNYTLLAVKALDITGNGSLGSFLQLHQSPYEIMIKQTYLSSGILQVLRLDQPL